MKGVVVGWGETAVGFHGNGDSCRGRGIRRVNVDGRGVFAGKEGSGGDGIARRRKLNQSSKVWPAARRGMEAPMNTTPCPPG